MKLHTLLGPAVLAQASVSSPSTVSGPPLRQVYTFPKNTFIENIAVRPNSHLLLTSLSVPDLYTINPQSSSPTAAVVHTFPNASGLSGITEIAPDVYAVVTGVWDLASTRASPGSLAVWTVDLSAPDHKTRVRKVAEIANSTIFNAVAPHPSVPDLLLAADSALGAIWRVDLATGEYSVAVSSPLFAPLGTAQGTNLGINGLRAARRCVYFTNSAQGLFGRVRVDAEGRDAAGAVEVLARSTDAGGDVIYDDFALTGDGAPWIASHPSYVVRVGRGGRQRVVNDTVLLLNPTSAAFGRGSWKEERTLYVTNGGRFVGDDLVDEGVVALDMGLGEW